jgi:hypothetical protein
VLPDSAKGWRKFDFDADNVHFPIYAFANPLPDPFEDLDLRQIATNESSFSGRRYRSGANRFSSTSGS